MGDNVRVEGSTRFPFEAVEPSAPGIGPGTASKTTPFYNPGMALNRDLTVATVAAEAERRGRGLDVADVLCGAGARALRIAREVEAPVLVHANDARPDALAALERGARENDVADRIQGNRGDAFAFLGARRFDVVDVDPYGSPAPFVDAAMRATRHDGLLLLTATDTAALCGTYPRVARRRYDVLHGLHQAPWHAEVGLRALLSLSVRAAGRQERGVEPLWSVSRGHWMRIAVRVRDGAKAADAAWRQLGWAVADDRGAATWSAGPPTAEPGVACIPGAAGPLWMGSLHSEAAVSAMVGRVAKPAAALEPLLTILAREADAPAFWIDLDTFCGTRSRPTVPTRDALRLLEEAGHAAAPTHMSSKGVRTDAPLAALARHLTS